MKSKLETISLIIKISMSLYSLWYAFNPFVDPIVNRNLHLLFALWIIFIPVGSKKNEIKYYINFLLLLLASVVCIYLLVNVEELYMRQGRFLPFDYIAAVALLIVVFEAVRQKFGITLPIIAALSLLYANLSSYLPGIFYHPGYSWERILYSNTLNFTGIFGDILGVSASIIIIFLIFGSFLRTSGAAEFFLALSRSLVWKLPSGPGLTAVMASSLFGSVNGSPVANAAGTGAFTIPLMKKSGYEPEYAGAIESASSCGGSLLPPVMGASAFIMATIIGCSYWEIVKIAVIPALLYFFAVGFTVHLHSLKIGLKPAEKGPQVGKVFMQGGHFLVPFILLVYFLGTNHSAGLSAFYSIISLVILTLIRNTYLLTTKKGLKEFIIKALNEGARDGAGIAAALALLGVVFNTLSLSGLPTRLVHYVVSYGDTSILIILLAAVVCFIFGLGVPTIGSYLLAAILMGPALVAIGIPVIAAHLFIYYYTMISGITPPVGVVSLVASQLSGSNYWRTGLLGLQLILSSLIIPIVFVIQPALLGLGSLLIVVKTIFTVMMSVIAFSVALEGTFPFTPFRNVIGRIILFISGVLLIIPENHTDLFGLLVFIAIVIFAYFKRPQDSLKKTDRAQI